MLGSEGATHREGIQPEPEGSYLLLARCQRFHLQRNSSISRAELLFELKLELSVAFPVELATEHLSIPCPNYQPGAIVVVLSIDESLCRAEFQLPAKPPRLHRHKLSRQFRDFIVGQHQASAAWLC